jgi:hypothetical protein
VEKPPGSGETLEPFVWERTPGGAIPRPRSLPEGGFGVEVLSFYESLVERGERPMEIPLGFRSWARRWIDDRWRGATTRAKRERAEKRMASGRRKGFRLDPDPAFRPGLLPDPRTISPYMIRAARKLILSEWLADQPYLAARVVGGEYLFTAVPEAYFVPVCLRCGDDVVTPRTGRPPDYCSLKCRRAVEKRRSGYYRRLQVLASDPRRAYN